MKAMVQSARNASKMLVGIWLGLITLVMDLAVLFQRHMGYLGETMYLTRTLPIALIVVGPLAAGLAATDAARMCRPGRVGLIMAVGRPNRRLVWAWAWTVVPAMVVHTVLFAIFAVIGGDFTPRGGWWRIVLALAVQLCSIGWFAALGSFLGRFVSLTLAGVAAAAAGLLSIYVLMATGSDSPTFAVLGDSGATVPQIGVIFNQWHLLGQLSALTISILVFLKLRLRSGGQRTSLAPSSAVAAVVTIAALVASNQFVPGQPRFGDYTPPDVCVGDRPRICYYHEHARYAGPWVDFIQRAAKAAHQNGLDSLVPDSVAETSRRYSPTDPSTKAMSPFEVTFPGDEIAIEDLVSPKHCPQMYADTAPSDVFWRNEALLTATWLKLMGHDYDWLDPDDLAQVPLDSKTVETIVKSFTTCEFS